jgi:acetylornithine deacetylase/succinyl-diaminopimelate desuccinylase-like protein
MAEALTNEAVETLRQLVRINTVNPPGNERPAQEYLAGLLERAGLEVTLAGPDPERPNLVARLRGKASTPSAPIRPAGATIRGRARSTMVACGAAAPST